MTQHWLQLDLPSFLQKST